MWPKFSLIKFFDKLYFSLSIIIIIGSTFLLYYNFIKPTEANFSYYKKASFTASKLVDYKSKYSENTRKRCYEFFTHKREESNAVNEMTKLLKKAEIKALIDAIAEALDDHEKYISNLQEFKYDKKESCFNYNGTLQEKNLNFYCERSISMLKQQLPSYRFYPYFNSFVILVVISLSLFLFRKWCIWLVRA